MLAHDVAGGGMVPFVIFASDDIEEFDQDFDLTFPLTY